MKSAAKSLTAERLRELLHYDPDTGDWTWKVSRSGRVAPGQRAGSVSDGYLKIFVEGKRYGAHRLAVLYMMGKWPKNRVDHRDGDTFNGRWKNLREATHSQNIANSKLRKDNSSGSKGVLRTANGRYQARIILGTFDTLTEAAKAYQRAAITVFGEFARAA